MSDPLTIATWGLVGVTLLYVLLTGVILWQNKKLIEGQTTPNVIAFAEGDDKHAVFFVIQNVGPGVAKDVRVDVPADWSAHPNLGNLGRIGFVARGISVMPTGARVHSFIAIMSQIDKKTLRPFTAHLTFADASGRSHEADWEIDLSQMFGIKPSDHAAPGNLVGAR